MKYSRTTRIITIIVIVLFLFATFGVVVLYLATPNQSHMWSTSIEELTPPTVITVDTWSSLLDETSDTTTGTVSQ